MYPSSILRFHRWMHEGGICMKANEINLLKFLNRQQQFIIPIYQRTYSWKREQCEQLWHDILRVAQNDKIPGHFIGPVVYVEKGLYQVSAITKLLVIDGQQRLTTISLLLSALSKTIDQSQNSEINKKRIENYYLFNSDEEKELRYKLLLTQNDKDTLTSKLNDKDLPENYSRRVDENYEFFESMIKESKIDPVVIYKGISKLIIVDVSLDRERDNPQLIFESMNSTGLDLTQADLIRNFILMGLEPKEQEELYSDYWHKMELEFGQNEYSEIFDRFMRDYLTVKNEGEIPREDRVYHEFKRYFHRRNAPVREIVADIYKFSKYFVRLALSKEENKDILAAISSINTLKVDVAYPFLIEVYDDYINGMLKKEEFINIISYIESYVFRRAVCGVATASLNKTFATLSKEIDKKNYLESFTAVMALKDSYRRFPDNDEFMRLLIEKDMYNSYRIRNYWLGKMENFEHKEPIDVDEYTIEHIMPQDINVYEEWKAELGSNWAGVHKRYLHTIGNLTLTGYNSEYGAKPFKEKRDMKGGFRDSHLRLNKEVAELEHWNEAEIVKRANSLATRAKTIWVYPSLSPETLAKYKKTEEEATKEVYTLADHPNLDGPMKDVFEQLRKRILNIDSSVREEIKKLYIAYKTDTNFVDIIPQKRRLLVVLNMDFNEVIDPKHMSIDITGKGKWGNGNVMVPVSSISHLDDVMLLIKQSFDKRVGNENE
jgi:uncharacterized protein with ParB-like and HNH nuclease domain/predicted transport protein